MEKQTIIQQIQPNCDNLYKNIKEATKTQHKTHRDIVEHTGVPRSTVAKFLSGALSNPCVFYVAALCKYLHLSMDSLFDIAQPEEPEIETNVAELKAKLDGAEKQVALLKERSKLLEAGIAERKPIIYGLAGMCVFLSLIFVVYLFIDVADTAHGLVRNNQISPALIVIISAIVVTALVTGHSIAKQKAKIKRTDKHE